MPRILLLIPTISYRASDFLTAAYKLGVKVIVASNERPTLEDIVPGHTLTIDFQNLHESVNKVILFAKDHPLDAVVSTDEEAVVLAAMISGHLGLAHNPIFATEATRYKDQLRRILTSAGIPTPRAVCFSITDPLEDIAQKISYPCVLKPIHLSASRGVIRADTPEEFKSGFLRITKILTDPEIVRLGKEAAQKILVESFISGEEVALEGLLQNGRLFVLALFDKPDPLNGPFFEETIYVTPSQLPPIVQEKIAACTQQACAAIGLKEGPIHAELRVNEKGPFIIEVAARSIGGICSRTLRFGLGVSLEEIILRHALKMPIDSLQTQQDASGVMMIPIPHAGILADVQGVKEASRVTGIEGVTIMIRRKQKVISLPEGRRYLGFIFARGASPSNVEAALRKAHRALKFKIT
ncbi:MAG: ATP-grasp domain-containing protein [Nitrospirae bacterium]|nr:ATP-grasp domain-containing protein [Candidatus Troglogloeales bacterium]